MSFQILLKRLLQIATSNGSFEGLNNAIDGTCRSNNMRIVIKVLGKFIMGKKY
jgi:hypothetical protein